MSDDDGQPTDAEETTVLDRRHLDARSQEPGAVAAGEQTAARPWERPSDDGSQDSPTVVVPAVRLNKAMTSAQPTAPQGAPWDAPDQPGAAPVPPGPAAGYGPAGGPGAGYGPAAGPGAGYGPAGYRQPAPAPVRPQPSSRDADVVRFPYRRPWTAVVAGVLAVLFGLEAAFELAFNWSRFRGILPGRFAGAVFTVSHSSSTFADQLSSALLGRHFTQTHALDHRLALGAFAMLWVIVGLLLLLARGSGIVLGLFWCGMVAVPAIARVRSTVDRYGWGLHTLGGAALTGAAFAPLLAVVLIAGLGASRRARLHSARPSDPEFVDVNEPGAVWRDR